MHVTLSFRKEMSGISIILPLELFWGEGIHRYFSIEYPLVHLLHSEIPPPPFPPLLGCTQR